MQSKNSRLWPALFVIVLFAAALLQYGNLQSLRDSGPKSLANDGRQATVFAFHVLPYYVFSEDFHLYTVRAKRVAEYGWSANLLNPDPSQSAHVNAPLQLLVSYLFAKTGGEPGKYALFIFTLATLAWGGSYYLIRSVLGRRVFWLELLFVVVLVCIAQNYGGFVRLFLPKAGEWSQWPALRALRVSTHMISTPLLVAFSVQAIYWRDSIKMRALVCAAILVFLAGFDSWACLFGLCYLGVLTAWRAVMAWRHRTSGSTLASLAAEFIPEAVVTVTALVAYKLMNAGMSTDALARGGFGAVWRSVRPIGAILRDPVFYGECAIPSLVTAALIYAICRALPTNRLCRSMLAMASVAFFVAALVYVGFSIVGADPNQLSQFYFRSLVIQFFAVLLVLTAGLREVIERLWPRRSVVPPDRAFAFIMVGCIGLLFAAHVVRIHMFVKQAAAEFALPKVVENLRPVVEAESAKRPGATVASLSPELNMLIAAWTNDRILLPNGFPLLNQSSDNTIISQAAALLRFYKVPPARWAWFSLEQHPSDQTSWRQSRVLAARQGLGYYLFHRETLVSPGSFTQKIAQAMKSDHTPLPSPDFVVVDDISRVLGQPDLGNYRRVFAERGVEFWVRQSLLGTKEQKQ